MSITSDEIEAVRGAAALAARLCLDAARSARLSKAEGEPVTVADFGSQALILRELARVAPEDAVRAEESSADLSAAGDEARRAVVDLVANTLGQEVSVEQVETWIDHRGSGTLGRTWAVDPIDGTKGFLRGDQFAVAVGLIEGGVPVFGVLACPRMALHVFDGVVAFGTAGDGAFATGLDGTSPRDISVSTISDARRSRILGSVETAHGDPELIGRLVDEASLRGGWVRIDSQAKYLAVAAGLAEVYVRPQNHPEYRERVWDHAAGAALVEAAGGKVTDLDGKPLDFSHGDRLQVNRGVLATNGRLHDRILEALARISPAP